MSGSGKPLANGQRRERNLSVQSVTGVVGPADDTGRVTFAASVIGATTLRRVFG
jgi:hypothetical protein